MEATSAPFIKTGLEEGSYQAWPGEVKGAVVAGGGLVIVGHPSAPQDPNPWRAWILNTAGFVLSSRQSDGHFFARDYWHLFQASTQPIMVIFD
jgi:hypothetical protein